MLSATSPIFAMPVSIVFLRERGSWRVAAGTLLSVVGVVLLTAGGGAIPYVVSGRARARPA